jgi:hypothetical protein
MRKKHEINSIIDSYKSGESIDCISNIYNIDKTSLYRYLHNNKVKLRHIKKDRSRYEVIEKEYRKFLTETGKLNTKKRFYVYIYLDPRYKNEKFDPCNRRRYLRYTYGYETSYKQYIFPFKPFYVGKGQTDRWRHHLLADRRTKFGRVLKNINNAGFKKPIIKIVENKLTHNEALQLEDDLIIAIGRKDIDVNGILLNKMRYTDWRRFLAQGPHSEETKEKMRIAALNRPPMSQEIKDKISNTLKNRIMSEEQLANLQAAAIRTHTGKAYTAKKWYVKPPSTENKNFKWKLITNLEKFCREHNLCAVNMGRIANHKNNYKHIGWKCKKYEGGDQNHRV